MIKSRVIIILATSLLVILLYVITNNPRNILSIESLNGQWRGKHKNFDITLAIKEENKCSFAYHIVSSKEVEKLNGDCSIDIIKKPYSFIMTNIVELNTSLYSIFELKSTNIIHMSEFSTKWKLQPVTFTNENMIILNRDN
jgi:hypothetical protein